MLRRVHVASGGNPFVALEMSRSLIRRGMPATTEALPVPATVGELVRERLEPLSSRAREALLVVSAAPRAPAAVVAAAAGGDGQIVEGLAEAEDAGILVQADGGLEFTHPLLASVVYSQVPPARRRRLHRSIAAALAGSAADGGADAKTRAWHLGLGAEGPDAGVADALDAAAIRRGPRLRRRAPPRWPNLLVGSLRRAGTATACAAPSTLPSICSRRGIPPAPGRSWKRW